MQDRIRFQGYNGSQLSLFLNVLKQSEFHISEGLTSAPEADRPAVVMMMTSPSKRSDDVMMHSSALHDKKSS